MSLEEINFLRDRLLRRRILETLYDAQQSPQGGLSGRSLKRVLDAGSRPEKIQDDEHLIRLCRDLTAAQMVGETDLRKLENEKFGLDLLFYKITTLGAAYRFDQLDPHPLIDTTRLRK